MIVELEAFKINCKECGSRDVEIDVGCGQNVGYVELKCLQCEREEYQDEQGRKRLD